MNNFICKIFGHKYVQVTETIVIEFLWKKKKLLKQFANIVKNKRKSNEPSTNVG